MKALWRSLINRLVPHDAATLARTWEIYDRLRAEGWPSEPTLGGRLVVRLSALTLAFYRALRAAGVSAEDARRQTADLTWAFYRPAAQILWRLAGLVQRDPVRRVQQAMRWARRFPYNPPAYQMRDVPVQDGYAFNVLRCPAADFFRAYQAGDLCQTAWCDLDDRLADLWGLDLQRQSMLAAGASHCDFCFRRPDGQARVPALTKRPF